MLSCCQVYRAASFVASCNGPYGRDAVLCGRVGSCAVWMLLFELLLTCLALLIMSHASMSAVDTSAMCCKAAKCVLTVTVTAVSESCER